MDDLDKETAAFEAELPNLIKDAGKFVVFFDGKNQGIFGTYPEALAKGLRSSKDKTFLVEQISLIPRFSIFRGYRI